MKNLSDEELVERIRTEDNELYAEIVWRYQQKLYLYLDCLTNHSSEAEDLLQNVFLKAYRSLFGFDSQRRFSTWIYRIAHNEGVNFLKKTTRRKQVSLEHLKKTPAIEENENDSVLDLLDKKQIKAKMKMCLGRLEAKYRGPLILHYFEEKSYREISDILRVPSKTVGTLIFRGKRILRTIYGSKEKDEAHA